VLPVINLLSSPKWTDYELLDSGDGQKLERFGPYLFVRPEVQALWAKSLPAGKWQTAHATFQPSGEESGGHWVFSKKIPAQWVLEYPFIFGVNENISGGNLRANGQLRFSVETHPGRHLGVFPECAGHWDWIGERIHTAMKASGPGIKPVNVLNLFGYTGLATLACAACGAKVTHLDASKKSVGTARENLALSGLAERPVRWIVDDALKFVEREARRGVKYDGILLDPPKFGRGPKGEVWEIYAALPALLQACRSVLSEQPLFMVLTVYAVKLPAIHAYQVLADVMHGLGGEMECGELVTVEKSAGRMLSQAVYARWSG
jgi:23S rRNA (cytosine1962-C5)-methyltransferase